MQMEAVGVIVCAEKPATILSNKALIYSHEAETGSRVGVFDLAAPGATSEMF